MDKLIAEAERQIRRGCLSLTHALFLPHGMELYEVHGAGRRPGMKCAYCGRWRQQDIDQCPGCGATEAG